MLGVKQVAGVIPWLFMSVMMLAGTSHAKVHAQETGMMPCVPDNPNDNGGVRDEFYRSVYPQTSAGLRAVELRRDADCFWGRILDGSKQWHLYLDVSQDAGSTWIGWVDDNIYFSATELTWTTRKWTTKPGRTVWVRACITDTIDTYVCTAWW